MDLIALITSVASTTFAAIFHFVPVLSPLLSPFKFKATAHADLRRESILIFGYAWHSAENTVEISRFSKILFRR